ncbi:hypothetical protein [Dichelobacter nodosus]|uniref:Uncharacterized protein n=1 Tax=Dichelobacter nodosus (strain VCS1703A) TaxID=246195 RepID=A5EVC7_DICNV|nr:hypothetical protein [Dichelobacter nodosus]ABQ14245.1 hypothetical protein DNO_0620 [Dichelobacter nodosus VCS1703A]AXM45489.1 hypothetical protein DYQ38_03065 [Dichelobacter nodosus]KNZ39855.1 hypothetical protein AKG33_01565 [Dichelobacter nodosus]TGA66683.1 hypothetical protein E5E99_00670 [Dichelobacter nodosus]
MAQTQFQVDTIKGNPEKAEKLQKDGMKIAGVKWVNVNQQSGVVVVTHEAAFNQADFQGLIDAL